MNNFYQFILKTSFIIIILSFWNSCNDEINFELNENLLEFSKDTVYLDTVFTNIGSSTYNLKVYNNSSDNIIIPEIKLANGQGSYYRLNVDGIYNQNDENGKRFENIELLANDSLYIFVETTIDINEINNLQQSFLYQDKIEFLNLNNTQYVELVTLVKDAVFIYPERYEDNQEYTYETLSIDFNGDGVNEETNIRGRFLTNEELNFTNEKPYVIYGYAAVNSGDELIIEKGSRIHFHENSGIIVTEGASIKTYGEISLDSELYENEVIFEGDRLEPSFEDIPGQWGAIWLLNGSIENEFNYTTIKNSSIGIYTVGGQNDSEYQLSLKNVKIFNSSNFGVLARSSSIFAENTIINKSGQSSFAATYGGNYDLNHCTISNYWNLGLRQYPSLLANNFFIDSDENEFVNENFQLSISNSIITGNQNIEFLIEQLGNQNLDFNFINSLIKFNDVSDYFSDEINYDFSNSEKYNNIYLNLNASFIEPFENDLRIDQNSEIIGLGSIEFAEITPFDILNTNRLNSPDLGAYQHIIIED